MIQKYQASKLATLPGLHKLHKGSLHTALDTVCMILYTVHNMNLTFLYLFLKYFHNPRGVQEVNMWISKLT